MTLAVLRPRRLRPPLKKMPRTIQKSMLRADAARRGNVDDILDVVRYYCESDAMLAERIGEVEGLAAVGHAARLDAAQLASECLEDEQLLRLVTPLPLAII